MIIIYYGGGRYVPYHFIPLSLSSLDFEQNQAHPFPLSSLLLHRMQEWARVEARRRMEERGDFPTFVSLFFGLSFFGTHLSSPRRTNPAHLRSSHNPRRLPPSRLQSTSIPSLLMRSASSLLAKAPLCASLGTRRVARFFFVAPLDTNREAVADSCFTSLLSLQASHLPTSLSRFRSHPLYPLVHSSSFLPAFFPLPFGSSRTHDSPALSLTAFLNPPSFARQEKGVESRYRAELENEGAKKQSMREEEKVVRSRGDTQRKWVRQGKQSKLGVE